MVTIFKWLPWWLLPRALALSLSLEGRVGGGRRERERRREGEKAKFGKFEE
jgi:hypothetical protein